jgi:hypothetical protein
MQMTTTTIAVIVVIALAALLGTRPHRHDPVVLET